MHKATVLLADDHRMITDAFQKLLEPQYDVVGTVTDGRALLEQAVALRPDITIIDIWMPKLNGLAAGQRLVKTVPKTKIIYITMSHDGDLASAALRSGACAYLLKASAGSELLKAIDEVLRGRKYVTPIIRNAMEDAFVLCPDPENRVKKLTPRQVEVLQLLAEGRLMKEVADILGMTPRTVAFHKYRIMETFGIKSNAELIRFAVKQHILAA